MKIPHVLILSLSLLCLLPVRVAGSKSMVDPDNMSPADSTDNIVADSLLELADRELREGTVVIETAANGTSNDAEQLNVSNYTFLRHAANIIKLNGDNWDELKDKLKNTSTDVFSIVHIGDSHLQADIGTGEVRRLFQGKYGDAGRGIIVPFKLAGTNEPNDYIITADCSTNASKLLKKPWTTEMSFTGIGVQPKANVFSINIDTTPHGVSVFRFVRIYHTGKLKVTDVKNSEGIVMQHYIDTDEDDNYTDVFLDYPVASMCVTFYAPSSVSLHGFSLSTERPGIIYHTIGNNGATYSSYINNIDDFGTGISTLYPDLIVVSLGTNEAFGRTDPDEFYNVIDRMVSDLKTTNPEAKILLTTPMECQKKVRLKSGGKRYTKYQIPVLCKELRNVILRYGKDKNIAVYDWYEVAGGDGSSNDWIANSLLSKDRVHHTVKGYELHAIMLHSAMERALSF